MTTDPRAFSTEKLKPPRPLPYVSRRNLKKVTYPLPKPTSCNICGGEGILIGNHYCYGLPRGDWPYVYLCTKCSASVGLHPHTDLPLGTLADSTTRRRRKEAHAAVRELRMLLGLSANSAREVVASTLGLPVSKTAIAQLNHHQCDTVTHEFERLLKVFRAQFATYHKEQKS